MPQPELLTSRLRLRIRTLADVEPMVAMDTDPEVRRFLGPVDPDEHRAQVTAHITDGEPDFWAIERRERPGLIGLATIRPRPDGLGNQVTWRLAREAWGEGLATEAAAALVRHAEATPGYGPLVAIIDPGNAASIAVARRIGMVPIGEGVFYGGPRILYGFAPTAATDQSP
ncbi:RimJ/RimL family protein N-acetyltransferase [Stella humosa]|uniref:RimJ/RimL family protein N-acetyltransferase n=1 Tax=Stella humosa TaxID=94 RepID=A0A3N1ME34_9PROT|nr:GNAT family N-acetyltransferase [Stella humosa]ROQ02001.1 RimJ/RimL family protein N-acetyltransferase [Stella humosa]BBK32390.1 N-acetyltransferase [Stella humosa]